MAEQSGFTTEKGELFCDLLRSGQRVGFAAETLGITRVTAYRWKKSNSDFAEMWDAATAYANERMEQVVYDMGINGDITAAMWWLRNHKPLVYDKATLIKMAILQSQLANGGIELDADGMPIGVPTNGKFGSPASKVNLYLPDNGRSIDQSGKLPRVQSLEEQEARLQALQGSLPLDPDPVPEPASELPTPATEALQGEVIPPASQASSVVQFAAHRQDDPRLRKWAALAS
jgi:hypothetical protein